TSNCGPQGSGDTLYWCVNFPVDVSDSTSNTDTTYKEGGGGISFSDTAVTVAVFDTGVDTLGLHEHLYHSDIPSCLDPLAQNGWNFPDKNHTVADDYDIPTGHGAIVSSLVVAQVNHYQKNNVRILPVKIHNRNGESDLFSVLCGFAYAR